MKSKRASSILRSAHDRGLYAIAFDQEASEHYVITSTRLTDAFWKARCYILGFLGS